MTNHPIEPHPGLVRHQFLGAGNMINTIIGESGRDTDRNPEGGDAQRLRAEHESGGPEGIARTSSDRNAGEI